jgi:hypothetical protein
MTKTEACRRVALAALLAGAAVAAAHEVRADHFKIISNGIDLNGIDLNGMKMQGLDPHGAGRSDAAADPGRLRLRAVQPASAVKPDSDPDGIRMAGSGTKPDTNGNPK